MREERENERRRMTWGGQDGSRWVLWARTNLLIKLPQDPTPDMGAGNCRAGFAIVSGEVKGERVVGYTNEAAWFQLFSKLNTGEEGIELYGRSSEFQRYCTKRRERGGEKGLKPHTAIVFRREGCAEWAPVIYG